MAITLPSGFKISTTEPVDTRIVMTKAEMLAIKKPAMPDKYICICSDDGKLYIYDKSIENPDPVVGRFRPYEDVIDLPKAISDSMQTEAGKAAMEEAVAKTVPGAIEKTMEDPASTSAQKMAEAVAKTLPSAMKETLEDPVLGQQLVNNMFESEHFEVTLDNKIDLSIAVIQAIDGN